MPTTAVEHEAADKTQAHAAEPRQDGTLSDADRAGSMAVAEVATAHPALLHPRLLLGLQELPLNPLAAFLITLGSISGALLAILTARLVAEFVLITFRINDHLGTLRSRTEM